MGLEVTKERFDDDDRARFRARLDEQLAALAEVVARPGFGVGETTIGAELELALVDENARPLRENKAVLDRLNDARVTLEINRHNVEINAEPLLLAGRPFTALALQIDGLIAKIARAVAQHRGRVVAVGILPTLEREDFGLAALTDAKRYRALSGELAALRGGSFQIHIDGDDPLDLEADDIALEGANTSFQLHLRVAPADYARTYNAAQIATAPALALGASSPTLLGHSLWDETRIALFRQSVDDRASLAGDDEWRPARVSFGHGWLRQSVIELFRETVAMHAPLLPVCGDERSLDVARAGGMPTLAELRIHNGTVWRWNRPVFDPTEGGHLRIELRALPAGPTTADAIATGAFLLGLTLGLAPRADELVTRLTYGHARRSFYQAARRGLDAELLWPCERGLSPEVVPARELCQRLVPVAWRGLREHGVEEMEVERWLSIITARLTAGTTGATWQRRALAKLGGTGIEARRAMLEQYIEHASTGAPVHTWPR